MKKLKLPQPYASLVIAGVLQTLPNQWNDLKYGEKIFIYADNLAKEFCDGLDYNKSSHRKIYNEMFMGNLPDGDFPTQSFLGYVRVYHTGTVIEDWVKDGQPTIFVAFPYKLTKNIENFDCQDENLEKAPCREVHLNTIQKKGSDLYVPVCKNVWHRLHKIEECLDVFMFWEDYMSSFTLGCFSLKETYIEEVDEIHFQYSHKTISFSTDGGVGEDFIHLSNDNKVVSILKFNLEYLIKNGMLIELDVKKELNSVKEDINTDQEYYKNVAPEKREFRPFIRFISVPMGGMTRWKR